MIKLRYASVCSGIEAASEAWIPLGWKPVWFSEIEKFPNAYLKHHYPDVPNIGDMTMLFDNEKFNQSTFDILVGGTPCQDYSIAGNRKGMAGKNGSLSLSFVEILKRKRPRWVVWENVPGVLSSFTTYKKDKDGSEWQHNDFARFAYEIEKCGYGLAWRILDAKYFGVAQQRRRVFLVGYLGGSWAVPASVLFERYSCEGHLAPSEEKREGIAPDTAKFLTGSGQRLDPETENLMPILDNQIVGTICCNKKAGSQMVNPVVYSYNMAQITSPANGSTDKKELSPTLNSSPHPTVCVKTSQQGANGSNYKQEESFTLDGASPHAVTQKWDVFRLMPEHYEALQGFPVGKTKIPYRGKPADECPDGPRYRACGNSIAVPVLRWIGERIQLVEDVINSP